MHIAPFAKAVDSRGGGSKIPHYQEKCVILDKEAKTLPLFYVFYIYIMVYIGISVFMMLVVHAFSQSGHLCLKHTLPLARQRAVPRLAFPSLMMSSSVAAGVGENVSISKPGPGGTADSSSYLIPDVRPDQVGIPSGLVAVYKPKGWTSSDVVSKFKGVLSHHAKQLLGGKRCKIKVGHGGTLDPLAEGVLVLGVGDGTKLMGEYLAGSKGYRAEALLGAETDTLDSEGTVTEVMPASHVTTDLIIQNLVQFRGDIMQKPPMYSALKVNGKKMYELARAGLEVEREERPVSVYHLELKMEGKDNQPLQLPHFGLELQCSGGFYVRSLISDLARACQTRAHMTTLLRTKQGPFVLEDCLTETQGFTFENICRGILTSNKKAGIVNAKACA